MNIDTYKQTLTNLKEADNNIVILSKKLKNGEYFIEISSNLDITYCSTPKQLIYGLSVLRNELNAAKELELTEEYDNIYEKINKLKEVSKMIIDLRKWNSYYDELKRLSDKIYNSLSGYDKLKLEIYPDKPTTQYAMMG